MIDDATVLEAIRPVRDPELDRSIVELDFVAAVEVDGDAVRVRLRLPTYFCAPNFSYLMVSDVREAVLGLPGVGPVEVVLEDHYTSEEINEGVNDDRGFAASFPGLTEGDDDLGDLRALFHRKALLSRQYRVSKQLREHGYVPTSMAGLTLGQVPQTEELDHYREARTRLGIAIDDRSAFLVNGGGQPIAADDAEEHLARARGVAFSIQLNAEFCSGVLATRYPDARPSREEEVV